MLTRIDLQNYRCFKDSKLFFHKLTIIAGKNNAGKSTVIEALRIVSTVVRKYKHVQYIQPPASLGLPSFEYGFMVNIDHLDIDLSTIVHQLDEDTNATITAYFDNKVKIVVTANPDYVFANIYNAAGQIYRTRQRNRDVEISEINIMPQIGLIRDNEKLLEKDTVRKNMDTRLSSRHFRNELLLYREQCFNKFKQMAETTWPGLRVQDLSFNPIESQFITLLIFDGDFSAEIGSMGSGLQMWLQIIWFISRCNKDSTIILDEPDVYMHPDMQSKILRLVKNLFDQTIIATHSIEIISEVEPNNIVNVDKNVKYMQYASNYKAVQRIVDIIGSSQNLSLIRLASARKCIFVEGKDVELLSRFHNILDPKSQFSIKDYPTVALGGWSRFNEALGAARLFYEQTNGLFKTLCILDRDYHLEDEVREISDKADESHLDLIVWDRKELENYVVEPKALYRIIKMPEVSYEEFLSKLEANINTMKQDIIYSFTDPFFALDRKKGVAEASRKAHEYVETRWTDVSSKISLVNGKDLISLINEFIKSTYNKNCSRNKILRHLLPEDVDKQLVQTIQKIIEK